MSEPQSSSDIILILALSAIIIVTILGNSLVVAAVATTPRLQTVTNYFVVSLALSDLLVGILVMPLGVVNQINESWPLGFTICQVWISTDILLCTASILNLCCISIDRYMAITSPVAYVAKRSTRLSFIMIAMVWVLSTLITTPTFIWNDQNWQNATNCTYNRELGYVIYSASGSFYIPTVIMVYVYAKIFAASRRRASVLMRETEPTSCKENNTDQPAPKDFHDPGKCPMAVIDDTIPTDNNTCEAGTQTEVKIDANSLSSVKSVVQQHVNKTPNARSPHERTASTNTNGSTGSTRSSTSSSIKQLFRLSRWQSYESRSSLRYVRDGYERAAFLRERRVAKSLSIVVGGYILCWLPFFVVYLLTPLLPDDTFSPFCEACLVWLGWFNSSINPFIYALNNNDFKKAFFRLTLLRLRRLRPFVR